MPSTKLKPKGAYQGKAGQVGVEHYWRNHRCEHCGMRYRDLKTGLCWDDVQQMARAAHEAGDRKHYSRGTVLGMWHQIKQGLWNEHVQLCRLEPQDSE